MTTRVLRQVDLTYRLATSNELSPTTQSKRWFFEISVDSDTEKGWTELLHRIFYNCNAAMRLREPGDQSWLALEEFKVEEVDTKAALTWDGQTKGDSAERCLPWCFLTRVWEPAVCWFVNEDGRYDGLDPNSLSELLAYRALENGIAEDKVKYFLRKVYPPTWEGVWRDREQRMANIACVRDPSPIKSFKEPGEEPWVSGPPDV